MRIITVLLFLGTLVSFGQDKFIEVEVRDTIQLAPVTFLYNVKVESTTLIKYDDQNFDYKKSQGIINQKNEELKSTLIQLGYKPLAASDINFYVGGYSKSGSEGYMIELENTAQI